MKTAMILAILGLAAFATGSPVQEVRYSGHPFQDDDPKIIEPGTFNVSLSPLFAVDEGSNHQGAIIAGLSGLVAEANIIIITLTLNFEVDLPSLDVDATMVVGSGYVDTRPFTSLPVGNFSGTGDSVAQIENLRITGSATLFINLIDDRVSIRILNVDAFSFDRICLNLGSDFTIGGNMVDWDDFCANFKPRFDAEWGNTQLKNQLIEKLRVAANVIIGQYTLQELIDLIGGGSKEGHMGIHA